MICLRLKKYSAIHRSRARAIESLLDQWPIELQMPIAGITDFSFTLSEFERICFKNEHNFLRNKSVQQLTNMYILQHWNLIQNSPTFF